MLALLLASWIATTASPATSPASAGALIPLHRTTYTSADTRWAWTIDPDRRPGFNSRDPGGATCSVSHDGVEAGRFHLERVPKEVVVSDRGWAVGYAEGPGRAPGEDLVSVVRLEPEGRYQLLFEWRGQGRNVPCFWLPGVRARDLRLDPLGGCVSLLLLRADEEWQAWGLAADLPGSPWSERLDARGSSYPEGPRIRGPEVSALVPVDLAPGRVVLLDALLDGEEWPRSIDEPELLPSGRLSFHNDRKTAQGAVLDLDGGPRVRIGPLVDSSGTTRNLIRILEDARGRPWALAAGHRPSENLRWGPDGPLQGLPHPGLAELNYVSGFALHPDGGVWVDRFDFVLRLDPRGHELGRLDRHADGTWFERTWLAMAPDGSLAVIDDRKKPSRSVPGAISLYGPDGTPRWTRHHLEGDLGRAATTGALVGAVCGDGVLLAAGTGPLLHFEPPHAGDFAGFTPEGTQLAIVTQDPPAVRFYDLP